MKATTRVSLLTDPASLAFAERLSRKRKSLATDPIRADFVANGTSQGFLRRIGFQRLSTAAAPEMTLTAILKEWRNLCNSGSLNVAVRIGASDEELQSARLKALNDKIGLLEYRVFGHSPNSLYPGFSSLEQWLEWRLPQAFPEHNCNDPGRGWTREFFAFAVTDATLSF